MKKIYITEEQYNHLKEINDQIYSGEYVNGHIIDITPEENDLPDYFMDKLIKPRKFKLQQVNLHNLLQSDPSFKEYYDSEENRYEDSDYEPEESDIFIPIVIVDGEVLDGYNRASELLRRGNDTIEAFVALDVKESINEKSINNNLIEIQPNKYIYHTSNPMFRNEISQQGLIPKGKSESWLSDTKIDGEVIFAINSDNQNDAWDSTYDDDIYKIDTSKLNNKWYKDPNFVTGIYADNTSNAIITFEPIPRNAIELIYKGTGKDSVLESMDKNVNDEFNKYKNSRWNSLREYTLGDIVNNWNTIKNNQNDNIQTIKYFVEHPNEIGELKYEGNDLSDGYHRLTAMKILGIKNFNIIKESINEFLNWMNKEQSINEDINNKKDYQIETTSQSNYENSFTLNLKSNDREPIGVFKYYYDIDYNEAHNEVIIFGKFRNQGYGKELLLQTIKFANETLGNFQMDKSITDEQKRVYNSLYENGLIDGKLGVWWLTDKGEEYLNNKESINEDRIINMTFNNIEFDYNEDKQTLETISDYDSKTNSIPKYFKDSLIKVINDLKNQGYIPDYDIIPIPHQDYINFIKTGQETGKYAKPDTCKIIIKLDSNPYITEKIHPSEAYRDKEALQTLVNGKRNIALVGMDPSEAKSIIGNNQEIKWIHVTPKGSNLRDEYVKRLDGGNAAEIIADKHYIYYRNNQDGIYKAKRLYDYMKTHNGFVSDDTPLEAAKIGTLLSYDKDSIRNYINKNKY